MTTYFGGPLEAHLIIPATWFDSKVGFDLVTYGFVLLWKIHIKVKSLILPERSKRFINMVTQLWADMIRLLTVGFAFLLLMDVGLVT